MPKKTVEPKKFSTLEDLYADGTLPRPTAAEKRAAKKRAKTAQRIWVNAGKKRGKWELSVTGQNLSLKNLKTFFDALDAAVEVCGDGDDYVFSVFPVIRELEDPKLMKMLDKRLAEAKKHIRAEAKAAKKKP